MNALAGHQVRFAAGAAAAVVLGTASTVAVAAGTRGGPSGPVRSNTAASSRACQVPALPGAVVDVDLSDMGAMMGPPHRPGPMMSRSRWWPHMPMRGMMRLSADPAQVRQGTVSLRAHNTGALPHEAMVMPLPSSQEIGQRPVGTGGKIDETGSLGEASRTCAAGAGHTGIAPGATGWTTLQLKPGRYELICNQPGHYAAGMYAELDVTR